MLGIRTGSQRVNEAFLSGDRFELACRDSKSNSSLPKDENFHRIMESYLEVGFISPLSFFLFSPLNFFVSSDRIRDQG